MYWCPSLKYSRNISPHNPPFKGTQRQSWFKIACAVPCPRACIKSLADATWGQALQCCYSAPSSPSGMVTLSCAPCPGQVLPAWAGNLHTGRNWEKILNWELATWIVPILWHMISSIPDKMSLAISHQHEWKENDIQCIWGRGQQGALPQNIASEVLWGFELWSQGKAPAQFIIIYYCWGVKRSCVSDQDLFWWKLLKFPVFWAVPHPLAWPGHGLSGIQWTSTRIQSNFGWRCTLICVWGAWQRGNEQLYK